MIAALGVQIQASQLDLAKQAAAQKLTEYNSRPVDPFTGAQVADAQSKAEKAGKTWNNADRVINLVKASNAPTGALGVVDEATKKLLGGEDLDTYVKNEFNKNWIWNW